MNGRKERGELAKMRVDAEEARDVFARHLTTWRAALLEGEVAVEGWTLDAAAQLANGNFGLNTKVVRAGRGDAAPIEKLGAPTFMAVIPSFLNRAQPVNVAARKVMS